MYVNKCLCLNDIILWEKLCKMLGKYFHFSLQLIIQKHYHPLLIIPKRMFLLQ